MRTIFVGGELFTYKNASFPLSIAGFEVEEEKEEASEDGIYVVPDNFSGRILFGGDSEFALGAALEDTAYDGIGFGVVWSDLLSIMSNSGMLNTDVLINLQSDGEKLINYLLEETEFSLINDAFKAFVVFKLSNQ